MKFSVIVPVYNVSAYLPKCLDSILSNDLADTEILLVDDGATDDSGAICDRYAAAHPDVIQVIHQPNGGLGAARNTGIEASKGEWLLFVDSDDRIAPNTLAVLRTAIENNSKAQIIGFQYYADDGEHEPIPASSGFPGDRMPFSLTDRPDYLLSLPSAWLRLWNRRLFVDNEIRYPARVWYEDIRTTAKLLPLAEQIVVIPEPLYLYLQRPGSIMNNAKLDRNREIIDAMEDILSWYRNTGRFARYERELEALAVQHVLLAASVRVARADPKHPLLRELYEYTEKNFPDWRKNGYSKQLPKAKRLALFLVGHRHYRLLQKLFSLKQ